jgi:1-aminocyclopropane-1-carboxylate deaminase/D-cysteine desulfhydrase-like pyridoxal-dependent ACC family enzyme
MARGLEIGVTINTEDVDRAKKSIMELNDEIHKLGLSANMAVRALQKLSYYGVPTSEHYEAITNALKAVENMVVKIPQDIEVQREEV